MSPRGRHNGEQPGGTEDIKEKPKFVSETISVPVELVVLENLVRGGHSVRSCATTLTGLGQGWM